MYEKKCANSSKTFCEINGAIKKMRLYKREWKQRKLVIKDKKMVFMLHIVSCPTFLA